uniref:Uncharacterized protein n=1 Tax=Panagrellus redivivus TaxID=6233 RepID=A0A7E4UWS6_PANRE
MLVYKFAYVAEYAAFETKTTQDISHGRNAGGISGADGGGEEGAEKADQDDCAKLHGFRRITASCGEQKSNLANDEVNNSLNGNKQCANVQIALGSAPTNIIS